MTRSDDGGLIIQSVSFTEEMIQVTYAEEREHAPNVGIMRTMFLSIEDVVSEVEEVLESLRDIVDHGYIILRNPPSKTGRSSGTSTSGAQFSEGIVTQRPVDEPGSMPGSGE